MKENKWIYFGAFLDDESVQKLKLLSNDYVKNKSWKLFCHHMTIAFNNHTLQATELYDYYKLHFGKKVKLVATQIGISDDAIAVKIEYKGKIANKIPHITLATPANGKPVNSNYITDWYDLEQPIILDSIISVFK